jgi:hypothetical protein
MRFGGSPDLPPIATGPRKKPAEVKHAYVMYAYDLYQAKRAAIFARLLCG